MHVTVTSEILDKKLILTIKDNGINIPEEARDKIFDMFYKVTEVSTGSGLGLYQAKLITKKLNGNIELISSVVDVNHF